MSTIRPAATLTPHFRDFLPPWVARQEWYAGSGVPSLRPVGFLTLEDPTGEVGIETHFVSDDMAVYQIPLTYRGAPLPKNPGAGAALIATAEHSVLGRRWIYDATSDPVWIDQTIRLVLTSGATVTSARGPGAPVSAKGRLLQSVPIEPGELTVEVRRVLSAAETTSVTPDAIGVLDGTWHTNGAGGPSTSGTLAIVRRKL